MPPKRFGARSGFATAARSCKWVTLTGVRTLKCGKTARGYRTEIILRAPLLTGIGWTEAGKQKRLYRPHPHRSGVACAAGAPWPRPGGGAHRTQAGEPVQSITGAASGNATGLKILVLRASTECFLPQITEAPGLFPVDNASKIDAGAANGLG